MTGNILGTNMGRYELVQLFEDAATEAYNDGERGLEKLFDRLAGHLMVGGEHMVLGDVQSELDADPLVYQDLMDYLPRNVVVAIAGN